MLWCFVLGSCQWLRRLNCWSGTRAAYDELLHPSTNWTDGLSIQSWLILEWYFLIWLHFIAYQVKTLQLFSRFPNVVVTLYTYIFKVFVDWFDNVLETSTNFWHGQVHGNKLIIKAVCPLVLIGLNRGSVKLIILVKSSLTNHLFPNQTHIEIILHWKLDMSNVLELLSWQTASNIVLTDHTNLCIVYIVYSKQFHLFSDSCIK